MQAGYGAPKLAESGADALLTRGRQYGEHRQGKVLSDPAGSKTPSMPGNIVCGIREALYLALPIAARSAW